MPTLYTQSANTLSFDITVLEKGGLTLTILQNDVISKDAVPLGSNPAWFSYTSDQSELPDGNSQLTISYGFDIPTITAGDYEIQVVVSNGTDTTTRTFHVVWSGSPTSFLPTDEPKLVTWYSSDSILEQVDNNPLGEWLATYTSGGWPDRLFRAITDNRPTYRKDVANGKPGILSDTYNDGMLMIPPSVITENTIICVFKPEAVSAVPTASAGVSLSGNTFFKKYIYMQSSTTSFGAGRSWKQIEYSPILFIEDYFGPGVDYTGHGISTQQGSLNSPYVLKAPLLSPSEPSIISRNFSATAARLFINGRLESAIIDQGGIINNVIWVNYGTGGYIFELLVFDSILTDAERQAIEGYLATKYNISNYTLNVDITTLGDTISHYKAESISGGDLSGSDVITWADLVGSNDLAAPSSGQRPERLASEVNGYAAVEFDGVTELLTGSITTSDVFTVGIVFNVVGTSRGTIFEGSDSGGTNKAKLEYDSSDDLVFTHGTTGLTDDQTGLEDDWHFMLAKFNNGFDSTFFTDTVRIDGVEVITGAVGLNDINSFAIGGEEADSDHVNVKIAEIIIYDGSLSLQDTKALEKHMQAKYLL